MDKKSDSAGDLENLYCSGGVLIDSNVFDKLSGCKLVETSAFRVACNDTSGYSNLPPEMAIHEMYARGFTGQAKSINSDDEIDFESIASESRDIEYDGVIYSIDLHKIQV